MFIVDTTEERDVRSRKAVVSFILIGNILRLTSSIVMVCLRSWGLGEVGKRVKRAKN